MLRVQNVRKSYGHLQVLKGIDLEIKKGEVVSIVGASGAGKSTLLHIIGTLDKPDHGDVFLQDDNLMKMRPNDLARLRNRQMGFIFQFHNLLPEFTALENVCIPGYIFKRNEKEVVSRAKELLDLLGLASRMDHKPSELSGGEQQRTAVARALINNPVIVFADEPSGNLDSTNAFELHQLFFKLNKDFNQTFVIVTHNAELANQAHRKLVMKDGIIIKEEIQGNNHTEPLI